MTRELETELVAQAREGDRDAFGRLVEENQKQVYNLALRMTGNADDAFDMAQEAFLKAWRSIDSFRGESKFSVWLYRLTSNVCLDFLRKRKRTAAASLTVQDSDGEELELEIPDERFSPESEIDRRELRLAVRRGLSELSEDYRRILTLRELGGLSYEEIGRSLGLEEGTVKSRLFRARKKLCDILVRDGNITGASPSKPSAAREV